MKKCIIIFFGIFFVGIVDRIGTRSTQTDSERLKKLAGFQIKILKHALKNFPKARRVVYSTCSLNPEENEEVIRDIISQCPTFKLLRASDLLPAPWLNFGSSKYGEIGNRCLYARPDVDFTNGFFIAAFERLREGETNEFYVKYEGENVNNMRMENSGRGMNQNKMGQSDVKGFKKGKNIKEHSQDRNFEILKKNQKKFNHDTSVNVVCENNAEENTLKTKNDILEDKCGIKIKNGEFNNYSIVTSHTEKEDVLNGTNSVKNKIDSKKKRRKCIDIEEIEIVPQKETNVEIGEVIKKKHKRGGSLPVEIVNLLCETRTENCKLDNHSKKYYMIKKDVFDEQHDIDNEIIDKNVPNETNIVKNKIDSKKKKRKYADIEELEIVPQKETNVEIGEVIKKKHKRDSSLSVETVNILYETRNENCELDNHSKKSHIIKKDVFDEQHDIDNNIIGKKKKKKVDDIEKVEYVQLKEAGIENRTVHKEKQKRHKLQLDELVSSFEMKVENVITDKKKKGKKKDTTYGNISLKEFTYSDKEVLEIDRVDKKNKCKHINILRDDIIQLGDENIKGDKVRKIKKKKRKESNCNSISMEQVMGLSKEHIDEVHDTEKSKKMEVDFDTLSTKLLTKFNENIVEIVSDKKKKRKKDSNYDVSPVEQFNSLHEKNIENREIHDVKKNKNNKKIEEVVSSDKEAVETRSYSKREKYQNTEAEKNKHKKISLNSTLDSWNQNYISQEISCIESNIYGNIKTNKKKKSKEIVFGSTIEKDRVKVNKHICDIDSKEKDKFKESKHKNEDIQMNEVEDIEKIIKKKKHKQKYKDILEE